MSTCAHDKVQKRVQTSVQSVDEQTGNQDNDDNDKEVLRRVLRCGPCDLLDLADAGTEERGSFGEYVLFLDICHNNLRLLCFFVNSVLLAEAAVLVHLESVRTVLLVLHGVVVALLALCARHCDFDSHFGTSRVIRNKFTGSHNKNRYGHRYPYRRNDPV